MSKLVGHAVAGVSFAMLVACGGRATTSNTNGSCSENDECSPSPGAGDAGRAQPNVDGGIGDAAVAIGKADASEDSGAQSSVEQLAYNVVDAKYSTSLSLIVMASNRPAQTLHLLEPSTGKDDSIALPAAPLAVGIDPAGVRAVVAYDAHISSIDLRTLSIEKTCDLGSDASDVAVAKDGRAYVVPATGQPVGFRVVDFKSCTQTESQYLQAGSRLALHPSETTLFASYFAEPTSIQECDLTASPIVCRDAQNWENWGSYNWGNSVWVSADGGRLYSGGPATLRIPNDATVGACTYGGSLKGVVGVQTLSEAPKARRVALIPAATDAVVDPSGVDNDTVMRIYETEYLGFVAEYALPRVPAAGALHGRFIFALPTMETVYVVGQASVGDVNAAVATITMKP